MEQRSHPTRIAIVGCGNVGATFAYALLLNRLSSEIVLVDANRAKAEGEAVDLNHAMPFAHPTYIWAGNFADCAGAAITVLSAGARQRPSETRLDMVVRNGEILAAGHSADHAAQSQRHPSDCHESGGRVDVCRAQAFRAASAEGDRVGYDP
jgi:malate/lactate dehydrogenase